MSPGARLKTRAEFSTARFHYRSLSVGSGKTLTEEMDVR